MKIALFPCLGLGDGLIAAALASNLARQGHQVEMFHPLLPQLQPLFPDLKFFGRPESVDELSHDKWIFFYEKLPWMQEAMSACPEKNLILNPIATPNRDYPFWEEGEFDGNRPFLENLLEYARKKWKVENPTKEIGIALPETVTPKKYPNRVIIHPTSSRAGKNWSKKKYLDLAKMLRNRGYGPSFVLSQKEQEDWPEVSVPSFADLCEVAHYVAESGFMIGNDSGIGHLASCLGVPTLTICRSLLSAKFWRPAWARGEIVVPPRWVPNIKGLRLRDQKWQAFVSTQTVYRAFESLAYLATSERSSLLSTNSTS
jgi:hypothetical protein